MPIAPRDPETDKTPKLPPKGFAIVARDGFQLQAEDSGKVKTVEFVTDAPGLASPEDFENTLGSVVDLAWNAGAAEWDQQAFNASEIGGAPSIKLDAGHRRADRLAAGDRGRAAGRHPEPVHGHQGGWPGRK
ncbi:MAG: hypothetical protein U1F43_38310 [Myxococcota bacterium]